MIAPDSLGSATMKYYPRQIRQGSMRKQTDSISAGLLYVAGVVVLANPAAAMARNAPWVGETFDGRACSEFGYTHGYGPYDYTNSRHRAENLSVVEEYHFTTQVRTLRKGENAVSPLGDLEYTIGAFPNHHQALYSMIRYATEKAYAEESRTAWSRPTRSGRARPPVECYLQRAVAFAPQDHRIRVLFGLFLHRKEAYDQALEAYEKALRIKPDSPEAHYNLGLLLFDMGRYPKAVEHARRAYELDYPLNGLRQRLAAKGYQIDG